MAFPTLVSFFLTLLMLANNVRSQGDVTSFQYNFFSTDTKGLTFERDASRPSGTPYVRLTGTDASGRPVIQSVGRVLYSTPINFWGPSRQASWETTIQLRISPIPGYNPADGMTFFIIPVNSTRSTGGNGGDLGIFNGVVPNTPIFAVEFDIYVNQEFDPEFPHIGIDINTRKSVNVTRFENAIGPLVTARINYDAPTRRIDVFANYNSGTQTVSYVYNLRNLLPQQVQVGISASVGPSQAASFEVWSWYFTSSLVWDRNSVDDHEDTYIKQTVM